MDNYIIKYIYIPNYIEHNSFNSVTRTIYISQPVQLNSMFI